MVRPLVPLVALSVLCGCASSSDSGTDPIEPEGAVTDVPIGQTFRLPAGMTARLPGGILVFFRGATDDSRCPRNVSCVWSGDATLHLRATVGRRDWMALRLHTHVLPRSGDFHGHTLTVVDLLPEPTTRRQLSVGDYTAVLRVD